MRWGKGGTKKEEEEVRAEVVVRIEIFVIY